MFAAESIWRVEGRPQAAWPARCTRRKARIDTQIDLKRLGIARLVDHLAQEIQATHRRPGYKTLDIAQRWYRCAQGQRLFTAQPEHRRSRDELIIDRGVELVSVRLRQQYAFNIRLWEDVRIEEINRIDVGRPVR